MTPQRFAKVDGLDLFVFDHLLDDASVGKIDRQVRNLGFSSRNSSNKKSEMFREWAAQLDVADFRSHPVYIAARDGLAFLYPELEFEFWDVHCNNTIFGDWAFAHRDSNERGAYSALYYANEHWDQSWFSETVFYAAGEPVVAVSVRPGRLVLFDSRIEHRAGVPSMNCPAQRFTLSLRFNASSVGRCTLDLTPETF
ncbi:MAG: hypothetical protein QNJ44_00500 [Rhodobacter sp.]|nr:hypothetical protein [Rhodobacter sp.]